MDIDGDGIKELVSGSYTKGVFAFKNLGQGQFAAGKNLLDPQGKVINPDQALAPAFGDWYGNGRQDMVLGSIDGPVYLLKNMGNGRFGQPVKMKAAGQEINAPDGGPCLYDLNGDGILDLLLGDGEGKLMAFMGKAKGGTDLSAPVTLYSSGNAWENRKFGDRSKLLLADPKMGSRLKPYITDWNGDGKFDIVVGDFQMVEPAAQALTAAQKDREKRLQARMEVLAKRTAPMTQKFIKAADRKVGTYSKIQKSPAKRQKWNAAFQQAMSNDKTYAKLQKEQMAIYQEINALQIRPEDHGFVWVMLQK